MGTPVPPEQPPIDPDLWYCVAANAYTVDVPNVGCRSFVDVFHDCIIGSEIIQWIQNDSQCTGVSIILVIPLWGNQKIISIGPGHETKLECTSAGC